MSDLCLRQPDPVVRWAKQPPGIPMGGSLPENFVPDGGIVMGGGTAACGMLPCADAYAADTDTWRRICDSPTARSQHGLDTCAVRNVNGAHALGGQTEYEGSFAVSHHRMCLGWWLCQHDLPEPGRTRFAASTLLNCLFVMAGYKSSYEIIYNTERYSPGAEVWTERTGVPQTNGQDDNQHCDSEAIRIEQAIYLIGGSGPTSHATDYVRKYEDTGFGVWTTLTERLNQSREHHAAEELDGYGYVFGGWDADAGELASIEKFNPSSQVWSVESTPLNIPTYELASFSLGENIYVVGGIGIEGTQYVYQRACWAFAPGQALLAKQDIPGPPRNRLRGTAI